MFSEFFKLVGTFLKQQAMTYWSVIQFRITNGMDSCFISFVIIWLITVEVTLVGSLSKLVVQNLCLALYLYNHWLTYFFLIGLY